MTQKIVTNAELSRFYCWGWDKWFPLKKLGEKCFGYCRYMYVPALAHLRKVASSQ